MHRTSSALTRTLRALTAFVTVWCLGCSSYEPLLEALAGSPAGRGMTCASGGGMDDSSIVITGASIVETNGSTVSEDGPASAPSFACSCQSCNAVSPASLAVAPEPLPVPSLPEGTLATLLSVARDPVVPPPQPAL